MEVEVLVDEVSSENEETYPCAFVPYSKAKAIRKKDELHSKSTNEFYYFKCIDCLKWHVEMTGNKRLNAKAKTQIIQDE